MKKPSGPNNKERSPALGSFAFAETWGVETRERGVLHSGVAMRSEIVEGEKESRLRVVGLAEGAVDLREMNLARNLFGR